jgi:hypothetical protein
VVGGFAMLGIGLALIPLPGPGGLVIAGGLGLLSAEFEWARQVRDRARDVAALARRQFRRQTS